MKVWPRFFQYADYSDNLVQGKGKLKTYWLLGEDSQEDEDLAGKEDDAGCNEDQRVNNNVGTVSEDVEEMFFPSKVTFHVSDHDNDSHAGNNIKLIELKNSNDRTKNQVSCS